MLNYLKRVSFVMVEGAIRSSPSKKNDKLKMIAYVCVYSEFVCSRTLKMAHLRITKKKKNSHVFDARLFRFNHLFSCVFFEERSSTSGSFNNEQLSQQLFYRLQFSGEAARQSNRPAASMIDDEVSM